MDVIRPVVTSKWAWLLLAAGLVWSGADRVRKVLVLDPRFMADPSRMRLRGPAWADRELLKPVEERLKALGPLSLFDPRFEARLRTALEGVPVVARVDSVRRKWPCRYGVSMRFHRPAALVEREGLEIPVTAGGIVLPPEPYAALLPGLLRIVGVPEGPGAPGTVWASEALLDGLAAAAQLGPHRAELAALGLGAIDVSEVRDPRRGVLVRGTDGTTVRWGRPRQTVGENPVARKIAYLRTAARFLEQVRGKEIDVRYGTQLYLRESAAP